MNEFFTEHLHEYQRLIHFFLILVKLVHSDYIFLYTFEISLFNLLFYFIK